jgi:hypothetical protein
MKRRGLFWLQVVITSLTALFMIVGLTEITVTLGQPH